MNLKLVCFLMALFCAISSSDARRSLKAGSSGSVIPASAMNAMVGSLKLATRSLLGGTAFPNAPVDNEVFMTSSITGPQMGSTRESSQGTPAAAGTTAVRAASDPAPVNPTYFQTNPEATQGSGLDPASADPLVAMQNPGYMMAGYQATHNIGAGAEQTPDQAMAEYVGALQGGSNPAQSDLPDPRQALPDVPSVLGHNFRELRTNHNTEAKEEIASAPELQNAWDIPMHTNPYGDAAMEAYPGYNSNVVCTLPPTPITCAAWPCMGCLGRGLPLCRTRANQQRDGSSSHYKYFEDSTPHQQSPDFNSENEWIAFGMCL